MKTDFHFDFETRSRVDLRKVGTVKYATHPSTEATLITWAFGRTGTVKVWRMGTPISQELVEVAANPSKYNFIAHNIQFDYMIWILPFKKLIPSMINPKIGDLTDNMAHTCHYRCGASLDNAAKILGLPISKDKEGRRIMLKQCKPNSRTGEFPELTDEEWEKFIHYGKVDTRLLRDIYYLVPPLPAPERYTWEWTFRRNLRGVQVDVPLINLMSEILTEEKPKLVKEFEFRTGGNIKINSPKAKDWFKQYYPYIENMQADTIRTMLADKNPNIPAHAKRAIELKSLAGSTSLAKIPNAVARVHNGRLYELLAYHYAQTKRWAGRGIQVQNFPRPDWKKADSLDFDMNINDLTGYVASRRAGLTDPLGFIKNLLRRIWVPKMGNEFYCGDWSKIEPTVLFWLTGIGNISSKWYEDMASTIYGIPIDQVGPDSDERNLGKSAALGCLAGDTLINISVEEYMGWAKLEDITKEMRVWDGQGFVEHGGLSVNGMKSVMPIKCLNIESTPDHLFLSLKGWRTAVEMEAEEDTLPLISEVYLEGGWSSETNLEEVSKDISLCGAYVGLKRLFEWINSGEAKPSLVEDALNLLGPERIQSPMLAATWFLTGGLESVGTYASTMPNAGVKIRKTKIGTVMEVEELPLNSNRFVNFWNTLLRWMGLTNGDSRLTGRIMMDTMRPETFDLLAKQLITKTVQTYDIKDCGPNNRYRIPYGIAHNCGYGMGHVKFRDDTFKKTGLQITEELAKRAVYAYRDKYKPITDLWKTLEYAFKAALRGTTTSLCNGKIHVGPMETPRPNSRGIRVRLPSGGYLHYHDAQFGVDGITYLTDELGGVARKKLYGGLLCEHVTSATARDILVPALYRLEEAGFDVLTVVHDEIWGEDLPGRGAEFERLMCINPSWCLDMRITAESKNGVRYLK